MRKIILSSLLGCCYFCISIGSTVHAEGLKTTKPLLVASSNSARSMTIDGVEYIPKEREKSITIDGVEYVPTGKEKKQLTSSENKKESHESKTGESAFAKFFDGAKNGELENFEMKGKKAVGIEVSLVNLGIGPTAEYWFTDNVAVLAHYSGLMDFQTIGVRGEYLFDKPFKVYNTYNTKPYVGIGYSQVKYTGGLFEADGSGADFHAGILTSAQQVTKGLMMRMEVGYSTTKLEMTMEDPYGYGGETKTPVDGWSGFGIAYGAYYYF